MKKIYTLHPNMEPTTKWLYDAIVLHTSKERIKLIQKTLYSNLTNTLELNNAIGASELLIALLGNPTESFRDFIAYHSDVPWYMKFIKPRLDESYERMLMRYNYLELLEFLPQTIQVVEQLKQRETIEFLGIYGDDNIVGWLDSIAQLEQNLLEILV